MVQESRKGDCEIFVGEGEFHACLRIGELRSLQEKLGVGPYFLATRFTTGAWMVDDVVETIRWALIGGGMPHKEAKRLVDSYIVEGYFADYAAEAQTALLTALMGVSDEEIPFEDDEDENGEGKSKTPVA